MVGSQSVARGPEASPENLLEMITSHPRPTHLVLRECDPETYVSARRPEDCDTLLSLRTTSLERRKVRENSLASLVSLKGCSVEGSPHKLCDCSVHFAGSEEW